MIKLCSFDTAAWPQPIDAHHNKDWLRQALLCCIADKPSAMPAVLHGLDKVLAMISTGSTGCKKQTGLMSKQ